MVHTNCASTTESQNLHTRPPRPCDPVNWPFVPDFVASRPRYFSIVSSTERITAPCFIHLSPRRLPPTECPLEGYFGSSCVLPLLRVTRISVSPVQGLRRNSATRHARFEIIRAESEPSSRTPAERSRVSRRRNYRQIWIDRETPRHFPERRIVPVSSILGHDRSDAVYLWYAPLLSSLVIIDDDSFH